MFLPRLVSVDGVMTRKVKHTVAVAKCGLRRDVRLFFRYVFADDKGMLLHGRQGKIERVIEVIRESAIDGLDPPAIYIDVSAEWAERASWSTFRSMRQEPWLAAAAMHDC